MVVQWKALLASSDGVAHLKHPAQTRLDAEASVSVQRFFSSMMVSQSQTGVGPGTEWQRLVVASVDSQLRSNLSLKGWPTSGPPRRSNGTSDALSSKA